MNRPGKQYGRTFFDLLAEHPKLTFSVIVLLIATVIGLAVYKVPVKIAGVEVGTESKDSSKVRVKEEPKIIHDTVIKTETRYMDKPVKARQPPIILPSKEDLQKKISVKHGDTAVSVQGQSANVNTGTNNGIIGNGNDVKINVTEIQRKLTDGVKTQLLSAIKQAMDKANSSRDTCFQISAMGGNSEAYKFAEEILQFLKAQNFKVGNSVGQFQTSPVLKGASVGFERFQPCLQIKIGYKPE